MRKIGTLEEKQAKIFSDYLLSEEIENTSRLDQGEVFAIWVHDEVQIQKGKELLACYIENPNEPKYEQSSKKAKEKKQEKKEYIRKAQKNFIHVSSEWRKRKQGLPQNAHVTIILIAICLVVALMSTFGEDTESLEKLFITQFKTDLNYVYWQKNLPEIFEGQVWRLITPIFIHFGGIHLLTNMLAFLYLGGMVERIQKWWFLLIQVVVIAVFSNLGQHYASGPSFGGMSGVAFGLFGYVWVRYRFNPYSGYSVSTRNVQSVMLWFFLCFTGLLGYIANSAHTIGLITGVLWGIIVERESFMRWLKSLQK